MTVKVKICGLKDVETALFAAASGAEAIGLVFAKSPRRVEVDRARAICAALPPFVGRVGVFADEEQVAVREIADVCGLTVLQFHGAEDAAYCAGFTLPILKAVRVQAAGDLAKLLPFPASGFVLDTYHPLLAGGTGRTFDWSLLAGRPEVPVILAGGLTPENVAVAIRQVRPYAVDVSSGVESEGRKDLQKIKAFIKATRMCD